MKEIMSILTVLVVGILVLSGLGVAVVTDIKSTTLTDNLTTMENQPPGKPEITGPEIIHTPGPHEYTFKAIDPDGDNVSYQIDWRDGDISEWTAWYPSGEKITRSHTYSEQGYFKVGARAKDTHGAIGDWGELTVTIPKCKQNINPIFFRFLERFMECFLMIE